MVLALKLYSSKFFLCGLQSILQYPTLIRRDFPLKVTSWFLAIHPYHLYSINLLVVQIQTSEKITQFWSGKQSWTLKVETIRNHFFHTSTDNMTFSNFDNFILLLILKKIQPLSYKKTSTLKFFSSFKPELSINLF